MSDDSVRKRIEGFRPVQGSPDYWLLEYGPLWVLVQLIGTGLVLILDLLHARLSDNPQPVTWAVFSPVYGAVLLILFVEAVAVRNFLKTIPDTWLQLWDGGALERFRTDGQLAPRLTAFLETFERKLNGRERLWLGIPLAALGLLFFWTTGHLPFTLSRLLDGSDMLAKLVTVVVNSVALFVPAIVVGYSLGIVTWKSIVTALYVRSFSKDFDLVVQPSHPDNAGGLRPLGNLLFALAAILIVASVALSGLIILADVVAFIYTGLYARIFLGLVIVLSLVVFFLPLSSAHDRMVADKRSLKPLLVDITRHIGDLERSVQTNVRGMDYKTRQEVFSEIDSLKELYKRTSQVPTWPFDRGILLKFATPQVFSLLTFIGLTDPIVSAIGSLLATLTGGQP